MWVVFQISKNMSEYFKALYGHFILQVFHLSILLFVPTHTAA